MQSMRRCPHMRQDAPLYSKDFNFIPSSTITIAFSCQNPTPTSSKWEVYIAQEREKAPIPSVIAFAWQMTSVCKERTHGRRRVMILHSPHQSRGVCHKGDAPNVRGMHATTSGNTQSCAKSRRGQVLRHLAWPNMRLVWGLNVLTSGKAQLKMLHLSLS